MGYQVERNQEDFIKQVQDIGGVSVIGQSDQLVKRSIASMPLRDVTATVGYDSFDCQFGYEQENRRWCRQYLITTVGEGAYENLEDARAQPVPW